MKKFLWTYREKNSSDDRWQLCLSFMGVDELTDGSTVLSSTMPNIRDWTGRRLNFK